ncbi:ATP-binding protein [Microbacterium suaedae]|uniref:ATP-binding protein n=1 Tax=Microbacterium suaedae TaxID=2067813 RepID=UPI000DA11187|nr:ATP-binding protein [Microbacterium suaedae]
MIDDVLPDIPRLFTGVAEWAACAVYILVLRKRLASAGLWVLLAAGLAALIATQLLADLLPLSLWTIGMLAAVGVMVFLIRACLSAPWTATVYIAARAFVLAELTASLHWQLHTYFSLGDPLSPAPILLAVGIYGAIFGLAGLAESRHMPRGEDLEVGGREVVGAVAIAAVTFAMSNLSFLSANTPFSGRLGPEIFYIRTLVDLCGAIALYAQQEWRREVRARAETNAMESLLRGQHEQYLTTKRAIDEVARRHHDMKHALLAIRSERDPELRTQLADELERSIADYGTRFRTGNAVLDTMLQAKAMTAQDHDVSLTCVADGALLDFMSVLDVCTVTGNALDNAIESAQRVEDPDRRSVRLALFAHDDFVMIRVENTFDGVLRRRNGALATRKGDTSRHGYGLRSIERTVESYGGSVSIAADETWFSLRMLFPRGSR